MLIIHILRLEADIHNTRSKVWNNLAVQADGGINMHMEKPYGRWPLAGKKKNNWAGHDLPSLLVDVDNRDFRPKSTSFPAAGRIGPATAEQMGPYPAEGETITQYDIPGRKTLHKASHPIPSHKSAVTGRDSVMFRPGFR